MAYRYEVKEQSLDDSEVDEFEVDIRAGEVFETITALETGGASLDKTKFKLKIADIDRLIPYISLSALGKTQDQALPMMHEFAANGKLKCETTNNTGAAVIIRIAFRIKLPE